jgi:NAD(P)H-dependent flavin oxidoreductase YrpB (nitropropane dioxygenase family)
MHERVSFLDSLRLERPVVQAGMGGGVAGGPLAGAVSAAGGLGTVGMMAPRELHAALAQARRLAPGRPVAANLLVPFIRSAHIQACAEAGAALAVLHGGLGRRWIGRLRARGVPAFVTVGTAQQASRALAAGAEGLVVQGLEAGGHLVAVAPLARALPVVLGAAAGAPVLAAGGVADAADVARLLEAGAAAAVAGTRFLASEESGAHEGYKRRVLGARHTLATELFGIGWPLRHRVIGNAATERWCARDPRGPAAVRALSLLSTPLGRAIPISATGRIAELQRPELPLFGPALPLAGMPDRTLDSCALYAGETVARIDRLLAASAAVDSLTPR